MFDFRHYIDLITEAQHDALVDAIIRQFPDQEKEIQDHATWASQVLKKADRINWYLGKLRAYLSNQLTPEVLGDYQFTTMEQLQHDLAHFYGYRDAANNVAAPIDAYQYQRQPIGKLISDLQQLEQKWLAKQNEERGVDPQPGDYVLFEFPGGVKWWWINRAYCPEEGRSGKHCGNVTGQIKTDQQILSLRNARNQVILTFIREPDGTLGEMKAKGNQKPQEQYHPHIMKLLLWDGIVGISHDVSTQYKPERNFNIFDLNEEYLNDLDQHKSKLIVDQANSTPFELLKENIPIYIKKKYAKYTHWPSVENLVNNDTFDQWQKEIAKDPSLFLNLPDKYQTNRFYQIAVDNDVDVISYIKNPSEFLQMKVIEKNLNNIWKIKHPSDNVLITALNKGVRYFYEKSEYIENLSEPVQIAAIQQDFRNIKYIINPTKKAISMVRQYYDKLPRPKQIELVEKYPYLRNFLII